MLIYTDNGLVDPWVVAQVVLLVTQRLVPLVAVQPVYMHPYAAAKMVATLASLHGRRIMVNLVAGGFRNDLMALNDATPHDERYARLVDYGRIMQRLTAGERVTFDGEYYSITNLRLAPDVPEPLRPRFMVSGSSIGGLAAAHALGAIPVKYPKSPADEMAEARPGGGMRVGIIAREDAADAWAVAHARFPADRPGQIAHHLAMKVSDSQWHQQLSRIRATRDGDGDPYWLWPFQNYKTYCPYLVGSYDRVGAELQRYRGLGFTTFILDMPTAADDLHHVRAAFRRAGEGFPREHGSPARSRVTGG